MYSCIDEGEKISTKAPAVGRDMMRKVAHSYLAHNTTDAIYRRFSLVMIFLACGRAGEAATATWNLTSWDFILESLYFDWSQSKSSKQKGISFLSDYDSYELDFFHSLGSYFICVV